MKKKHKKRLIIVAVIIGIFLVWYFGFRTLSVLGGNVVAYNSYSWTDDNHLTVTSPSTFGTASGNSWGLQHAYYHSTSNSQFCSYAGINADKSCIESTDWNLKAQTMTCSISGTLTACFEGESCPQGEASGSFNIENGIVTYEYGTLACSVKSSDIVPFISSGSPLYTQWWSKPGRSASWSTLLVTSGTITFKPCSGDCNQECPTGQTKCSDGICKENCEDGCPTGQTKCSDGTCKEDCSVTPPNPNYLSIIIIVLILAGITGGLYYLYKNTK